MFRPVPMKRALLLVPRDDLDAVIESVASLGVLHLLDLSGREEWSWGVQPYDVEALRRSREETLRQIDSLVRFLDPPATSPPRGAPLPDPEEAAGRVAAWSREAEALRAEQTRLAREIDELTRAAEGLRSLAPSGVGPAQLRDLRFLHAACGWIESADLERLEESLARVPHRLVLGDARGSQRVVFAFVLPRDRDALERALESTGCVRLELPEAGGGAEEESARDAAARLEAARARRADLDERIARRAREWAEPLALARAAVERELLLLEARGFASRSESVVFVAGWIPADRAAAVEEAVRRATRGRCHVRLEDPVALDSVRRGGEAVPILFRNPAWVRPFERLVSGYGAPRWGEIDPTPVVALAIWLMFGLMFGDVGHGAVLGGVGLFVFRRMPRYRDYGVILMECGLSSLLFGVAYGSVFGNEQLLPALWFRPMDDVPRLLRVGAGFGLVLVGLSFGLGVLNALLRRDWSTALFGSPGLLAATAYWIAAALGLRWLVTGRVGVELGLAVALLAAPLAGYWLWHLTSELRGQREEGGRRSILTAVLGSSIELLDLVVRGVANTVSFVRLAAFAVSHAGLLLAVYAVAESLADVRLGSLWSALVIVAGNALVIALEGLIVSIQSVRLVYYEFFSRFHAGTGLPYRPLRLRAGRAAEPRDAESRGAEGRSGRPGSEPRGGEEAR